MENVEKQLETVLGRFGIASKKGETKWMVCCPAHDDYNPSLSITLDENTKRLLIYCHAGCATEKVLSSVGLSPRDLDFSRLKDQEILTLASLAEKKGLPVDYLKNLCWADRKNSGIVIPYMDEMGVVVLNRRRVDWKQFRWEGVTADPLPYGLDRLNRDSEELILCEGETDTATLWYSGFHALGIPGASMAKTLESGHLKGIETLILIREPDQGGNNFISGICKRLEKIGYQGQIKVVEMARLGIKDPNEFYLQDKEHFSERMREEVQRARDAKAVLNEIQDEKRGNTRMPKNKLRPSDQLLELIIPEIEIYYSQYGDPCVTFRYQGILRNCLIKSDEFESWLCLKYRQQFNTLISKNSLELVIGYLSSEALLNQQNVQEIYLRVAAYEGNLYIDLSNGRGDAVEITKTGWSIIQNPPVKFSWNRFQLPLPHPVAGGNLSELREFINIKDEGDWILYCAFLVGAFQPHGPYPILILTGEQGSAKSTLAEITTSIINPTKGNLRIPPKTEKDLMVAAKYSWLLAWDNVSKLPDWFSDGLCRISTGGSLGGRALYTDDQEKVITAQRPQILNGIDEFASRPDLLDRSIRLTLPPIIEGHQCPFREVMKKFQQALPRIIGALCDALSEQLRNEAAVCLDGSPRMADFAKCVVAAEPALPWEPGRFLEVYREMRRESTRSAIENSTVAKVLMRMVPENHFIQNTMLELYRWATDEYQRSPLVGLPWPKAANSFSKELRRITTELRRAGFNIETMKKKDGRYVTITNMNTPGRVPEHTNQEDVSHEEVEDPPSNAPTCDETMDLVNR